MELKRRNVNTTQSTDRQVKFLKDRGYGDFTAIVRIAIDRMYNQERSFDEMAGKDMVYCDKCGAEYNRLHYPNGHPCDPEDLRQIERDRKADEEVRKGGHRK